MQLDLPEKYIEAVKKTYGKNGEKWMKDLPDLLSQCAAKWNIKIGETGSNLSLNYIANVQLENGEEAILKTMPHGPPFMEMEALEHLQDHPGIVNLIHSDHDLAAMVIEKFYTST
jgi:streptomycin 6-kinase